jgi:nitrogenase molybdenum-iron protein alpha/beta subunit
MGGADKLEQALLDVDRDYKPPLIIVHDNCCSGVIMDDCQGVIDNLKDRVKAKMIYVPSPGFTSCWADNMSMNMPHYVEIMDPPEKVDPEAVNLLGMYKEVYSACGHTGGGCNWDRKYPTDSHELVSYITGMGLKLHRVLMSGGYEYVRTAPEAAINAHNCVSWGHPLGLAMEEKFGTKMMHHAFPIGVEATKRWIMELAEAANKVDNARRMIEERSQEAQDLTNKVRSMVSGKVAVIEGVRNALSATTKALALARFVEELGLTPHLVNLHPAFISSKPYVVNFFVNDGTDPQALYGPYPYGEPVSIDMLMEKMGWKDEDVLYFPCDIYDYDRAGAFDPANVARVNTGQPFRRVKGRPRYLGFSGTAGILRDLVESVEASKRGGRRPTAYGRMYGNAVEDLVTEGA